MQGFEHSEDQVTVSNQACCFFYASTDNRMAVKKL